MNLDQMKAFLALAEELHFGRTAERLYLSQPRVTRLITALETEVGGLLFERSSRRVRLTPLGADLEARLRPAHAELLTALGEASLRARGTSGTLRLGFVATTPVELVTRLVQAFEAGHPECRVALREHLVTGDDWDVWGPLRRGETDALVYMLVAGEPDLTMGPVLCHFDRVLLVAPGHRLAGRPSVSVEELARERVIERPPTYPSSLADALSPPYTPSGRPIPREEPASSFAELASLVARGRIVHPTIRDNQLSRRADVVAVPLSDLPALPFGIVWCTAHANARIRALAAVARTLQQGNAVRARPTAGTRAGV